MKILFHQDVPCFVDLHNSLSTHIHFFNLNLSRALLFGGPDPELGEIKIGYFDPSLSRDVERSETR
jgi:hypothetical protein